MKCRQQKFKSHCLICQIGWPCHGDHGSMCQTELPSAWVPEWVRVIGALFHSVISVRPEWERNLCCFKQLRFWSCLLLQQTSPSRLTHCVLGPHLGALHVSTHSLLTPTLWSKYCHYSHVTVQDQGPVKLSTVSDTVEPAGNRSRIWT